jgi:hypothetical protein
MATCVGGAVSVLTWLALSYIVRCNRGGNGQRLFRRSGFFLKWCSGTGRRRVVSLSVEDTGREHDDSADENERDGRCEQAASRSRPFSSSVSAPQLFWIV